MKASVSSEVCRNIWLSVRLFGAGRFEGWVGKKFGIDEIVALYGLRGKYGNGTREHRAGEGEGMELAAFAAGVDLGGQISEQFGVEGAAGEGRA